MAPKRDKQIHGRKTGKDLPDHVLHGVIFPRLSFKTLCRLKCVSKDVKELLSPETTTFWKEQALSPSPSSTSFMYVEKGSLLRFFPEPKIIGVPDPSLDHFLFKSHNHVELISSTNGLAIFRVCVRTRLRGRAVVISDDVFYIGNLATREFEMIPKGLNKLTETLKRVTNCFGLAFDPSKFPNYYRLVNPIHEVTDHGKKRIVSFDVFRSETGKWTRSVQEICVRGENSDDFIAQPIYSNGLIYWNCLDYVVWFDPEKDCAGTFEMPFRTFVKSSHEMGIFNRQVYCISMTAERLGVCVLKNGTQWEERYNVEWQELERSFETRIKKSIAFCEKDIYATPLAFDGKCVFIAMKSTLRTKKEELLCFDMEEKSISMTCKSIIRGDGRVLHYHNCAPSMPKIFRSTN